MLILLEGVDLSGKSTLAREVAEAIEKAHPDDTVDYLHSGPLTHTAFDAYVKRIDDYLPGTGRHIVADRWHVGEMIYGPLKRGKAGMTEAQFRWVELWLASRGANTWHITQDLDVLTQRRAVRGEDFVLDSEFAIIKDRFQEETDRLLTGCGTLTPQGSNDELVKRIIRRAVFSELEMTRTAMLYKSYVGQALPHTLLVGEKRGGKPPHPTTGAFLPVGGNSAEYLLSALEGGWWRGVGLVNAVEEGPDRLAELYEDLFAPQIVALGQTAHKVLDEAGLPQHGAVPHPQYIRRFHHADKANYFRVIRDVARTGDQQLSWQN